MVVENELERIDGLLLSSSGDNNNTRCTIIDPNKQLCGGCGKDLLNHLALGKKHSVGKTQHAVSYCCSKWICHQCYNKCQKPHDVTMKAIYDLTHGPGGQVHIIEEPGIAECSGWCPGYNSIPLLGDKQIAKALEKFAMRCIPWYII